MANYGAWQGAERATGNMLATGMRLMEFNAGRQDAQERLGIERDRLGIAKEAAEREKTAFENAEKKRVEEETQRKTILPGSMIAPNLKLGTKLADATIEAMKSAGYNVDIVAGDIHAPKAAWDMIKETQTTANALNKTFIEAGIMDYTMQAEAISNKILELQQTGKGKPEEIATLTDQWKALQERISKGLMAKLEFREKFALEQLKQEGKTPNEIELRDRANKGDKEAQKILNDMEESKIKIAKEGRAVFSNLPTTTPGVYFSRADGKYHETDAAGNDRILSSEEVKKKNLQFREETPTNDIKVMQQSVPSVLQLVNQSRVAIDNSIKNLGPLASRWRELWSGKIGAKDPEFRKLMTDINLLQTRLMKMHVGARGGEYIMKHFQEIIDSGKDSPENLKAALSEIETYANEVGQSIVTPPQAHGKKVGRFIVESE